MIKVMQHLQSFTGTSFRPGMPTVQIAARARHRILDISGVEFVMIATLQLARRLNVLPAVWY